MVNKREIEVLNEILLRMSYDPSKTLNENIALIEQKPDNLMPFQPDNPQYRRPGGDLDIDQYRRDMAQVRRDIEAGLDKIADIPLTHNQLAAIEIITGVLAMIPTPASPFLYAISISAGLMDANKYRAEGDTHSAWISLFLVTIPELKLAQLLKGAKGAKYTKKELGELYKRYKNGAKLADEELEAVYDLEKAAATPEAKTIMANASKQTVKEYLKLNIKNKPLRWLSLFLYNGVKLGLWELPKVGVMVAGIYIGADQLYLYLWGNDADRQKSDLKKVADVVQNFGEELYNKILGKAEEVSATVPTEKYDKAVQNVEECDHKVQTADEYLGQTNNGSNSSGTINVKPEFQWVPTSLTKEKIVNGEGYIKTGMSGAVVKELQEKLNHELYTDDDGNPLNPDGKYGQKTKQAVKSLQIDNGLEDDGVAGKDTFKILFNL